MTSPIDRQRPIPPGMPLTDLTLDNRAKATALIKQLNQFIDFLEKLLKEYPSPTSVIEESRAQQLLPECKDRIIELQKQISQLPKRGS